MLIIIRRLEARKYDIHTEQGQKALNLSLNWLKYADSAKAKIDATLKSQLNETIRNCFGLTELDLIRVIEGGVMISQNGTGPVEDNCALREEKFYNLLPKGGWFEWYAEGTAHTESPLTYHIFSSLSVLGAALGRRVYKKMGPFTVFPNYCVILVGPTGIKKTSATDMAQGLIHKHCLCPIMADAITPEALATAMKLSGHHFIYAPEMSVFFGKQRYNEGLVTRILRLLDCPAEFKVSTQMRGEEIIYEPTVTMLAGTTMSLMSGSSPGEILSGGFLNRFVVVVENDSDRCYPNPDDFTPALKGKIDDVVSRFKSYSGAIDWSPAANAKYEEWYRARKHHLRHVDDDATREVMARTFNHTIRTAMLVHLAQCDNLSICEPCFTAAAGMMEFIEESLPQTVRTFKQTQTSSDADYVLQMIYKSGGAVEHSALLRKVSNRMNATQLKGHIATLTESGRVKEGANARGLGKYYIMLNQEEDK